jgi:hypothetical protein
VWWQRPKPEPALTPEDVDTVMRWMWDVRADILAIRTLLEQYHGDGNDETDS